MVLPAFSGRLASSMAAQMAAPELMPTPAQRKYMIERIRYLRSEKSDIPFYPMDFQNDGEFVGGCGTRNINHKWRLQI